MPEAFPSRTSLNGRKRRGRLTVIATGILVFFVSSSVSAAFAADPPRTGGAAKSPTHPTSLDAITQTKPDLVPMRGRAERIDDATWEAMQGKSWRPNVGCPAREQLELLFLPYVDFFNKQQIGELIVAKSVSKDVLQVFAELHQIGFPIASIRLIDKFGGSDAASMAANNTSAFNCRPVTGGGRLSEHSFGTAIDINPVQNPYVSQSRVLPSVGQRFAPINARIQPQPGMIRAVDPPVAAFAKIGWKWGGNWSSPKDYQHFSKSGR
jgi:hypothetical protein